MTVTLEDLRAHVACQRQNVLNDKDYVADQVYVGDDPATALRQMWLLGRKHELKALIKMLDTDEPTPGS